MEIMVSILFQRQAPNSLQNTGRGGPFVPDNLGHVRACLVDSLGAVRDTAA